MKKFLGKIVVFTTTFIILLLVIQFGTSSIISAKADFKIVTKPQYLVLGHSHSECAFNDKIISDLVNFSSSGEAYFYTYFKAKQILEENPSIKTVFLEFSNNQIAEKMNDWTWDDKHLNNSYQKFSPFMKAEDQLLLFKNNPKTFLKHFLLPKKNIEFVFERNFDFTKEMGGYRYLDNEMKETTKDTMQVFAEENDKLSSFNLFYLSKIIELCSKYDIDIYLIRSPKHQFYKGYLLEDKYLNIRDSCFKDIEFFDFSKFPLKEHEFADDEHLNYKGANKFSTWFDELLKDSLLYKTDKQMYINMKMENIY